MPAPFHALRDSAIAAVDAVMAEDVRLLFLNAQGRADTSRVAATVKGVLRVGAADVRTPTNGKAWDARIAAGEAALYLSRVAYGTAPALRKGDKVKALERAGEPLFEVMRIDDRRHDRIVAHLGEA
ncbi:MAG: hypothetical protein QM699_07700 [Amaricoccus sp.]|uniref:hypothetical protein n=1 Tax=Amaricoccus sp. TaxID=1872485 RepID=UPI0039E53605